MFASSDSYARGETDAVPTQRSRDRARADAQRVRAAQLLLPAEGRARAADPARGRRRREPLILLGGGGAELKAYASAGQTLLLLAVVPAFGSLASRTSRIRLLT